MRNMLLASAAVFGMALAVPALAQNNTPAPNGTAAPGQTPAAGSTMKPMQHGMGNGMNMGASNVNPATTHSVIAPRLPQPNLPANASPSDFLRAAQQDVQRRRGGAAQAALGDAETRLLNRAVPPSEANQPDRSPAIQSIEQARQAVANRDWQGADQHITAALQSAQMAESGNGNMMQPNGNSGTMPMTGTGGGTVGSPGMSHMPPATAPSNGSMQPNGGAMPSDSQ